MGETSKIKTTNKIFCAYNTVVTMWLKPIPVAKSYAIKKSAHYSLFFYSCNMIFATL